MGGDAAVIQLVTRCASAEEFVERFARYTSATDVVVPALPDMSVGTAGPFVICLKDRSVMLKGRCEVTEIRPVVLAPGAAPSASGLALMRLHLREMDAHSAGIHLRLMERHASWAGPPAMPAPAPAPSASADAVPAEAPPAADASAVTVVQGETTAVSPLPRPETRVAGAAATLPANPLGDLDAADLASFIEHTLLETDGAAAAAPNTAGDAAADGAAGVAQPVPAARAETRLGRSRIARRAAYAACALVGLSLGIALGSGSNAAPLAAAPIGVQTPPPAAPPPLAAPPIAPTAAAAPDGDPIPAPRYGIARATTRPAGPRLHRPAAKRSHRGLKHRAGAVAIR